VQILQNGQKDAAVLVQQLATVGVSFHEGTDLTILSYNLNCLPAFASIFATGQGLQSDL
jgi:hypothetical protein